MVQLSAEEKERRQKALAGLQDEIDATEKEMEQKMMDFAMKLVDHLTNSRELINKRNSYLNQLGWGNVLPPSEEVPFSQKDAEIANLISDVKLEAKKGNGECTCKFTLTLKDNNIVEQKELWAEHTFRGGSSSSRASGITFKKTESKEKKKKTLKKKREREEDEDEESVYFEAIFQDTEGDADLADLRSQLWLHFVKPHCDGDDDMEELEELEEEGDEVEGEEVN
eukprot:Sspe_Gene.107962::Locus_87012_Transcript_1_1_Confidence_1.000_Length_813::g.107962::m.107962